MRRDPTQADVERWQPLIDRVAEAREALKAADEALLQVMTTCDGRDETTLGLVESMGDALDAARMAARGIEHPVISRWSGGSLRDPGDGSQTSLAWR